MPLENLQLAAEPGLTPKRGAMLAWPPGTGKTTLGRALARRLRGKFSLIDGTVISGTEYFYHKINSIFPDSTGFYVQPGKTSLQRAFRPNGPALCQPEAPPQEGNS